MEHNEYIGLMKDLKAECIIVCNTSIYINSAKLLLFTF